LLEYTNTKHSAETKNGPYGSSWSSVWIKLNVGEIAKDVYYSINQNVIDEEAIKAHFLICFLALTVYRYLEKVISLIH